MMPMILEPNAAVESDLPPIDQLWDCDEEYRLLEAVGHEHDALLDLFEESPTAPDCSSSPNFRALDVKLKLVRRSIALGRMLTTDEAQVIRDECLGDLNNNALRDRLRTMSCLPIWVLQYLEGTRETPATIPASMWLQSARRGIDSLTSPLSAVPSRLIELSVTEYLANLVAGQAASLVFTQLLTLKVYQRKFMVARHAAEVAEWYRLPDRSRYGRVPNDNSDQESITRSALLLLRDQCVRSASAWSRRWRMGEAARLTTILSYYSKTAVERILCCEYGIPYRETNQNKRSGKESPKFRVRIHSTPFEDGVPDDEVECHRFTDNNQILKELRDARRKLEDLEREVLRLKYVKGCSFKEIAERLDLSPVRVSQIHQAVLAKLRSQMC